MAAVNLEASSGFYGVYENAKRWKAKITYDSKDHHLDSFDTKQEAALAYDREARQCGGGQAAELREHRSSAGGSGIGAHSFL
jgi:hypothetical protein